MPEQNNSDYKEVIFCGLPGPTHHYGALSYGNIASISSDGKDSNPQAAALQSLDMMEYIHDQGVMQAIIPPHDRPHIPTLRATGIVGTDEEVLRKAYEKDMSMVAKVSSAAGMWAANAATVAPSIDTVDGRLHITPAALSSMFHRSLEHGLVEQFFRRIFSVLSEEHDAVVIHDALRKVPGLGDEGAANHMRFANSHGEKGTHVFVYGSSNGSKGPKKYPARQTLAASREVASMNQLADDRTIFVQQRPEAIDSGVFHNDVIGVNNLTTFMLHEMAYMDPQRLVADISRSTNSEVSVLMAHSDEIALEGVVSSYVFNSQLISLPNGEMMVCAPAAAQDCAPARQYLEKLLYDPSNPITQVQYFDLHQSMSNGGGPACLRLRIVLSKNERENTNGRIFVDNQLISDLRSWCRTYYRDKLNLRDLGDPSLMRESRAALDELTQILNLGSLYDFQK